MEIYKKAIVWTLYQLDQDHELEEFVDGIPGLYESKAFSSVARIIAVTYSACRAIFAPYSRSYLVQRVLICHFLGASSNSHSDQSQATF